jgi:hypothetical protein
MELRRWHSTIIGATITRARPLVCVKLLDTGVELWYLLALMMNARRTMSGHVGHSVVRLWPRLRIDRLQGMVDVL